MKTTRHTVLATLLVTLGVTVGQAFAGVPNVELVTFVVVVSGYLLGSLLGAVVGGTTIAIHSVFNAFGAAPPPVLVAQVVAYALIGVVGSPLGRLVVRLGRSSGAVIASIAGAAGVLTYQVFVNVASWIAYPTGVPVWGYIAGGVTFAAVQIGWNAALFAVALRPTLVVCGRVAAQGGGTAG